MHVHVHVYLSQFSEGEICTFEDVNICGYAQDRDDDDFDWTWGSGPTPTLYTGPSVDQTYGTSAGEWCIIMLVSKVEREIYNLLSVL